MVVDPQLPRARARRYAAYSAASALRSALGRAGLPHATSSGGRWATPGPVVDVTGDGEELLVRITWHGTPDRRAELAAAVRDLAPRAGLRLRPEAGAGGELHLEIVDEDPVGDGEQIALELRQADEDDGGGYADRRVWTSQRPSEAPAERRQRQAGRRRRRGWTGARRRTWGAP